MLHMGLMPPVLSATTSPYATNAACCNASNLESIFDSHHTELNETMGWPNISNSSNSQQHARDFVSSVTKLQLKCQETQTASWVLKIRWNHLAVGVPPRTPLGSLQRSPKLS